MNMPLITGIAQRFQPAPPAAPWAHWDYSPEEWQQLDHLDWGAAQHKMLLRALPLVVPFLGLCGLLASILLEKLSVDDFLFALSLLVLVLLFVALSIPFGLAIHPFLQALRRHSARQNGPRSVTIGPASRAPVVNQGLWQAGFYIPLQQFMVIDLKDATLSPGMPYVVQLRRRFRSSKSTHTSGEINITPPWSDTLFIPVPFGHKAEAAALVERFRRETIQGKTGRPVRLQSAWLFSYCVSFFKNGWSK